MDTAIYKSVISEIKGKLATATAEEKARFAEKLSKLHEKLAASKAEKSTVAEAAPVENQDYLDER